MDLCPFSGQVFTAFLTLYKILETTKKGQLFKENPTLYSEQVSEVIQPVKMRNFPATFLRERRGGIRTFEIVFERVPELQ